jgi:hypothetical protein
LNDQLATRYIAITHQEWLLWIERGELRCASRVVAVRDADSSDDFERLLAAAPDFPTGADDALIVARLRDIELANPNDTRLSLSAVDVFMPLTTRASKILAGDSRRAGVALAAPRFEASYQIRRERLQRLHAHSQGERFVKAANLQLPSYEVDQLVALAKEVLRKPKLFAKIERRRNRVYFGWAAALSKLSERIPAARWREIRREAAVEPFVRSLAERPARRMPIATEGDVRRFAGRIRAVCRNAGIHDCRLTHDSVVAHWVDYLEMSDGSGLEDDTTLRSLGRDLRVIEADEGQDSAALAAYWIGQHARAETVSHLFYASRAEDYSCLTLSAPRDWMGDPAAELGDEPELAATPGQTLATTSLTASEIPPVKSAVSSPRIGGTPSVESKENLFATTSPPDDGALRDHEDSCPEGADSKCGSETQAPSDPIRPTECS